MKNDLQELKQLVETLEALNQAISLKAASLKSAIAELEFSIRPPLREAQVEQRRLRLSYTMKETAELLGISYSSVWQLTHRGLLKPSRALRHYLFSQKEIERFLEETQV